MSGSDTSVPASERSSLCKDCVSNASLLIIAGGAVAILLPGLRRCKVLQAFQRDGVVLLAVRRPFAARAPPR